MGCGGSKHGNANQSQPITKGEAKGPPPAPEVPEDDPTAQWEDPAAMQDPLLDREIGAKKINKKGEEIDAYDRDEKRPDENAGFGMFEVEQAGAGDQALAVKPWVGQIEPPSNAPSFKNSAPAIDLQLEYIYGYRCFDTRQNVFYTQQNEVVYMAAAVGITLNTQTNTQKFMGAGEASATKGHSDDITALCISEDRTTVATGEVGKNPKIIVWNNSTMVPINEFRQGRGSRGVTALAFNKAGNLLASCALDNDHTVRIWDWKSGNKLEEQKGGPDKILDCAWHPSEDTLLTVGIKHVYFWKKSGQSYDKKRGIFGTVGTMCNLTTAGYLPDGTALTGGTNGSIYMWTDNNCTKQIPITDGKCAIHTLRVVNEDVLCGGSDKKLYVLNSACEKTSTHTLPDVPRACDMSGYNTIVGCLNGDIIEITGNTQNTVMQSHSDGEVWGLDINQSNPNVIVTSGDDNKVKTWDINQRKCKSTGTLNTTAGPGRKSGYGASTLASTSPNQQARCVTINPKTGNVAIGFNDGSVQIRASVDNLDSKINEQKHPKEWIETMRFSPDGKWLAIGSHDQFIYILNTSNWELASKIQKHSSYLTALDWSCDSTALHSTDGAYELLYFKVDANGNISQDPSGRSAFKDEEWASWSTPFGWPVQGIFGGVIDYTHVNRVDRSCDQQFYAVGNDWGLVEIFNNPNGEGAKSRAFRGHSEHVTNVKWTNDYVFSTGGYDQCIMQWRIN